MNEQRPIKRTNKTLIVIIVIIAVLIIALPFIVALSGVLLIPKMMDSIQEKAGYTNYEIKGLRVYIPKNWQKQGDYLVSPSRNCRIIGGTSLFDQDRAERTLIQDELEHREIILNDINISYGFKNNGTEKIYSYFFEDYNNKYFILFRNKVDSDEECDSYIEKLEQSITLDPKGEQL